MKPGRSSPWYRGRVGFVLSVALITLLVASIFAGIFLYNQNPASSDLSPNNTVASGLVDFTCHLSYAGEAFTITVGVNLTDGMDRDEAVFVTNTLFDNTLGQAGHLHQLRSADIDELGVWTVELIWGYSATDLGHWFAAEIDPFNRTIVYNHCK